MQCCTVSVPGARRAIVILLTAFLTSAPRTPQPTEEWFSNCWACILAIPTEPGWGECPGAEGNAEAGADFPMLGSKSSGRGRQLSECPVTQEQTPGSQGSRATGGGMRTDRSHREAGGEGEGRAQGVSSPSAHGGGAAREGLQYRNFLSDAASNYTP